MKSNRIQKAMEKVGEEAIRVAEQTNTKLVVLGKNGKILKITPKQARARIKREKSSKKE